MQGKGYLSREDIISDQAKTNGYNPESWLFLDKFTHLTQADRHRIEPLIYNLKSYRPGSGNVIVAGTYAALDTLQDLWYGQSESLESFALRSALNSEDYQKQAEIWADVRNATQDKTVDFEERDGGIWGYTQNAIVGAMGSSTYSIAAGIPVAGVVAVALQERQKMEDIVASQGGDVTSTAFAVQSSLWAGTYAAVEYIAWEGMKDLFTGNLGKQAEVKIFERLSGKLLTKEFAEFVTTETLEEVIQDEIEGVFADMKLDLPPEEIVSNAVAKGAETIRQSVGSMGVTGLFGIGKRLVSTNTRMASRLSTQDKINLMNARDNLEKDFVEGKPDASKINLEQYSSAMGDATLGFLENGGINGNGVRFLEGIGLNHADALRLGHTINAVWTSVNNQLAGNEKARAAAAEQMLGGRKEIDVTKRIAESIPGAKEVRKIDDNSYGVDVEIQTSDGPINTTIRVDRVDRMTVDVNNKSAQKQIVKALQESSRYGEEWKDKTDADYDALPQEEKQRLCYEVIEGARGFTDKGDNTIKFVAGEEFAINHESLHFFLNMVQQQFRQKLQKQVDDGTLTKEDADQQAKDERTKILAQLGGDEEALANRLEEARLKFAPGDIAQRGAFENAVNALYEFLYGRNRARKGITNLFKSWDAEEAASLNEEISLTEEEMSLPDEEKTKLIEDRKAKRAEDVKKMTEARAKILEELKNVKDRGVWDWIQGKLNELGQADKAFSDEVSRQLDAGEITPEDAIAKVADFRIESSPQRAMLNTVRQAFNDELTMHDRIINAFRKERQREIDLHNDFFNQIANGNWRGVKWGEKTNEAKPQQAQQTATAEEPAAGNRTWEDTLPDGTIVNGDTAVLDVNDIEVPEGAVNPYSEDEMDDLVLSLSDAELDNVRLKVDHNGVLQSPVWMLEAVKRAYAEGFGDRMREAADKGGFEIEGIVSPIVVDRVSPEVDDDAKAKAREAYAAASLDKNGQWCLKPKDEDKKITTLEKSRASLIVNDQGGISQSDLSGPKRTPQMPKESIDIISRRTAKVKQHINDYNNGDFKVNLDSGVSGVINKLRKLFALRYEGRSNYADYVTPKGTVTFRLADHNANGNNFASDATDKYLSVYIEGYEYDHIASDIEYTEFKFDAKSFAQNPQTVVDSIVHGVEKLLSHGEFIDESGLAEKKDYPNADDALGEFSLGPKEYKVFRMANEDKWHLIGAQLDQRSDGTYAKDGETRPTRKIPVGEWYGLTESGTGIVSGMFKSKTSVARQDGTEVKVPIDLWDDANAEFRDKAGIGKTEFAGRNRWYYPHAERVDLRGQNVPLYRNDYGPAYASVSKDRVDTDLGDYSLTSLAEAAGLSVDLVDDIAAFNFDGKRVERRGGKAFVGDKEITFSDVRKAIEKSPIAALLRNTRDVGYVDDDQMNRQMDTIAGLLHLYMCNADRAMTQQFVGSLLFTAMKENSDKQYSTTYDFPSICTKTQAIIDAMSALAVARKGALTSEEIAGVFTSQSLYKRVIEAGLPVPCPECYVFSRWIGVGGLLDNIDTYQKQFGDMTVKEASATYDKYAAEIMKVVAEWNARPENADKQIKFGKGRGKLASEYTKKYNKLREKIEKADNQGVPVSEKDRALLKQYESQMNAVKAMTWINDVYFTDSSHTTRRENFKVPPEVLFDLNRTEEFARDYPEAWAFRCTQGAGYGKAITPYAESVLGEGISVEANKAFIKEKQAWAREHPGERMPNVFLMLDKDGNLSKEALAKLASARAKEFAQAFIGGQRIQSTSDARPENMTDYLISLIEMQAMGAYGQGYTKVLGAVEFFADAGFGLNMSMMPLGGGLNAEGVPVDTAWGGVPLDEMKQKRLAHEHAGSITIGVNDEHIRKLYLQAFRDFMIPYHASGGKAEVVNAMRKLQERGGEINTVRSTDYTQTQSEKEFSDYRMQELGYSPEKIDLIKKRRAARLAILTGKGNVDMKVVKGSRFLSHLYDMICTKGGEWYGVKLTKDVIGKQIFPNEYWDKSVDYEHSAKITKDYLAYCDELGFLHKFSGMLVTKDGLKVASGYNSRGEKVALTDLAYKIDENGNYLTDENGEKIVEDFYWKLLVDRRMFGNDGKYLPQTRLTLNSIDIDKALRFANYISGAVYDKAKSMKLQDQLRQEEYARQDAMRDLGEMLANDVAEDKVIAFCREQIQNKTVYPQAIKQTLLEAGYPHDAIVKAVDDKCVVPGKLATVVDGDYALASRGVPYQGSKGQVADRIINVLPAGDRFVDLFAGGGAMTHAAMMSGKYHEYRMNDLDGRGQDLFLGAARGDYANYNRKLTKADWDSIKDTPEAHLWSRMGNGRQFNEDPETQARSLRRVQRIATEVGGEVDKVEASKTDYRDVNLRDGDVVYADIPYANTDKGAYGRTGKFDYAAFNEWAQSQTVPVYASSYEMPAGWTEIWSGVMRGVKGMKTERLFVQDKFAEQARTEMDQGDYSLKDGTEDDGSVKKINRVNSVAIGGIRQHVAGHNGALRVYGNLPEVDYSLSQAKKNVKLLSNNLDKIINNWNRRGFGINMAFKNIADAMGFQRLKKNKHGSYKSIYRNFVLPNSSVILELRLGDHRGVVANFRQYGSKVLNTSIVIKFDDKTLSDLLGVVPTGVPIEEFSYDKRAFKNKDDVLPLITGLRNLLESGTYADLTGKCKYRSSGNIDAAHRLLAGNGQADIGIYIRNTGAHFVDHIFDGTKTIETRTENAWHQIEKVFQQYGMQYDSDGENFKNGIRVAIISKGKVQGYVTVTGVHHYASESEFKNDTKHAIPASSPFYTFDANKGKVGLILKNPLRIGPYSIPKASHPTGVRDASSAGQKQFSLAYKPSAIDERGYGADTYLIAAMASDMLRGTLRQPHEYDRLKRQLHSRIDIPEAMKKAAEYIARDEKKLKQLIVPNNPAETFTSLAGAIESGEFDKHLSDAVIGGMSAGTSYGQIAQKGAERVKKNIMRDGEKTANNYNQFVAHYGIDLAGILTGRALGPESFPDNGQGTTHKPKPQHIQKATPISNDIASRAAALLEAFRQWQADQQSQISDNPDADIEGIDFGQVLPIPAELVEQAGLNLQNANDFAAFLKVAVCSWIAEENGLNQTVNQILADPVFARRYAVTMKQLLQDLSQRVVDPNNGFIIRQLERAIAALDSENAISHPDLVEKLSAAVIKTINMNALRYKRSKLIEGVQKRIHDIAGVWDDSKIDELERDVNRRVMGRVARMAKIISNVIEWGPVKCAHRLQALEDQKNAIAAQTQQTGRNDIDPLDDDNYIRAAQEEMLIQKYGALKYKTPAEIVTTGKEIEDWLTNAAVEHAQKWAAFQLANDELQQKFVEGIVKPGAHAHRDPRKGGGIGDTLGELMLSSFSDRLRLLCRGASGTQAKDADEAMRELDFILNRAAQRRIAIKVQYERDLIGAINKATKGTGMSAREFLKHLEERVPNDVSMKLTDMGDPSSSRAGQRHYNDGKVDSRLTWGQVLYLLSYLEQTQTYNRNIKLYNREGQADYIRSVASQADLVFLRELQHIMVTHRGQLSNELERITGFAISSPDPMYFPFRPYIGPHAGLDTSVEGAYNPLAPYSRRIKHSRDVDESRDIIGVYMETSANDSNTIAFGVDGIRLRSVLTRQDTIEAIYNNVSKFEAEKMRSQLTDIITDGRHIRATGADQIIAILNKAATYTALGFNFNSALKQTMSIPAWAGVLPDGGKSIIKYMLEFDRAALSELIASDGFTARYGNHGVGPAMFKKILADPRMSWRQKAAALSMTPIQFADFLPGMMVGVGLYKSQYEANRNSGMNPREAKERALVYTWQKIEESQQSDQLQNLNEVYRRMGTFGHAVMKYANSPVLQASHLVTTFRLAMATGSKEAWTNFAHAFIANHVIMPACMYGCTILFRAMLGQEPPEDWKAELIETMLLGSFGRIIILGTLYDTALRAVMGIRQQQSSGDVPALDNSRKIIKDALDVTGMSNGFDFGKMGEAIIDLLKDMSPLIRHITTAANNYGD